MFLSSKRLSSASLEERVRWLESNGASRKVVEAATARLVREVGLKELAKLEEPDV